MVTALRPTKPVRKLSTGGDPDAKLNPPAEEDFIIDGEEQDYIYADTLKNIAAALMERRPGLSGLRECTLSYYWKRKGGTNKEGDRLGGVKRFGAIEREVSGIDFVVWLAADHLQGSTAYVIEAALYHELLKCGTTEKGTTTLHSPDVVCFSTELSECGLWRIGLKSAAKAWEQAKLFEDE